VANTHVPNDVLLSLFANAPIAAAVLDADLRLLYLNAAFAAATSAAVDPRPGLALPDLLPEAAGQIRRAAEEMAQGRSGEYWLHFDVGADTERHFVGVAFPLPAPDGRLLIGTMMRDLTARTRADRERQLALGQAQTSQIEAEAQRDFLRMVLENAPMGISVCEGDDHRLMLVNDFAIRLINMPREAIIGKPVAETFPEAFALVRDVFDRVYATGETITVPERLVPLPDGRALWVYASYAPVLGSDGKPVGVMSLSLDISSRKRIERILESQKRILELTAQDASLPMLLQTIASVVTTQTGDEALASVLLADERGERLHYGAASKLPSSYVTALDGLPIGPASASCGTAAFRRERVIVTDIQRDPLWSNFQGLAAAHGLRACWSTPIVGSAGNLLGTIGIYYLQPRRPSPGDVELIELLAPMTALAIERCRVQEDRSRLLEAERRARQDAEAANRSKDDFVAALSHELRTSLNAILGWTRLLRGTDLDEATRSRGLESIERNTRMQSQLVEDLLDMSRIITGKLRLDVRSVELSIVVDAAVDAVRPAADAKNIRLQKILDPRAAPIAGDPDRLQQVVWNLLSNAIKFTPKGGRVQVRLERVNSHVEILVSDTGSGIDADLLTRVFERFQQGDAGSGKSAGLGLGLSIARHLVELHGGTIHAASEGRNRGATFTVKLPIMVTHADRQPSESHPTAATDHAGPVPAALPAIRILVVEDDDDGREVVSRVLSRAGAEVRGVSSAADAYGAISEWNPDVLISDIEMPGENGYTLITRLRSEFGISARKLPAIALTAYARVEDRIKALAAGFQMHVPKPVEPAELVAVVAAVITQAGPFPAARATIPDS